MWLASGVEAGVGSTTGHCHAAHERTYHPTAHTSQTEHRMRGEQGKASVQVVNTVPAGHFCTVQGGTGAGHDGTLKEANESRSVSSGIT